MQPFEPQQLPIDDIQWDSLIPLIVKANRSLQDYTKSFMKTEHEI
jgi:hypothetical protein